MSGTIPASPHLAAAVGTPVVALFGPTDPAVWSPRGDRIAVIRRMPMEEITVDDVIAAMGRVQL